jgi:hydrogenase maturation protease
MERWWTALSATEEIPVIQIPATRETRCLILACGNSLRSDDGVGPRLAEWAEERFEANDHVRIVARQQWTPDLAEEISIAESVLFVDSSIDSLPGHVNLIPVEPHASHNGSATHHLDANELMGLARELYGSRSAHSMLLTVGAGSTELGESFSDSVEAALPRARGVLEKTVLTFLES